MIRIIFGSPAPRLAAIRLREISQSKRRRAPQRLADDDAQLRVRRRVEAPQIYDLLSILF
jgi:hypothetical protein